MISGNKFSNDTSTLLIVVTEPITDASDRASHELRVCLCASDDSCSCRGAGVPVYQRVLTALPARARLAVLSRAIGALRDAHRDVACSICFVNCCGPVGGLLGESWRAPVGSDGRCRAACADISRSPSRIPCRFDMCDACNDTRACMSQVRIAARDAVERTANAHEMMMLQDTMLCDALRRCTALHIVCGRGWIYDYAKWM